MSIRTDPIILFFEEENERLRAEVKRLTADFLEYGGHKSDCRGGDGDNLCTCGYLMARAALR
jgi:hypothetical protein